MREFGGIARGTTIACSAAITCSRDVPNGHIYRRIASLDIVFDFRMSTVRIEARKYQGRAY